MDPKIIDMMKYARIPLALNLRAGESVLIMADTKTDPLVWQALAAAAHELGIEPTVTLMTPRPAHGYEPTAAVAEAMKAADTVIYVTSTAMAHTKASGAIKKLGKQIILMEEVTPEMLSGGPATADYDAMNELGMRVRERWIRAKRVHIKTDQGTDLKASVEGRKALCIAGKIFRGPEAHTRTCAFPDGESAIAPVEGSGQGVVVFDTSCHMVGLLRDPIKVTVKDGRAVTIEGGAQAVRLREILESQNDENCFNFPAEIAIGLNPKVVPMGIMRADKKLYGSVHMAFGSNDGIGGTTHAKVHIDGLMRYPTVVMDDEVVIEKGVIKV